MPYYKRDPKTHHNFDNHPYRGYIGIIVRKDTAIVYWGEIGMMEKKMETSIVHLAGCGDFSLGPKGIRVVDLGSRAAA